MDFHGSLEEFQLPEIIQFLSGAKKTGALRLVSDQDEGDIYLRDGEIVHATSDESVGEEAVYALVLLSEGKFDFEPDITSVETTVSRGQTNLLLEAARRKDEWDNVISLRIPNVDLIPEFALPEANDTGKQITLNTSEWIVLSKIDGQRSLREIAKACHLSVYQCCRLLYSLVSTDLIRLLKPQPSDKHTLSFPD